MTANKNITINNHTKVPQLVLWMRRQRVIRRLLAKYRDQGKIDEHLHHELYRVTMGNAYKDKREIIKEITRVKADWDRRKTLDSTSENSRL
ncbi:hypothetical protein B0I73DRAFT_126445 [Yarrowia lipolytica]|uniref:Large ribosomal subunit protein eL19 domain-containing protein n=1 Tax=Yarrowia lipolytica TaxID=4952 RepID=A0A371BXP2_YARLL|nr:hypothetical protein BKA91DRAFT_142903 [Yarrowia lipolytica]KAE8168838.1 hypothetical protein BKA90DRAFT_143602 [Yarrowia lipolytica]KAJ8057783.1 hypothetical protein LXG23DRAFT_15210 [Yarrowia lipolytica]QNQ00940.1 60S ribosomal protein L19-A [Yarrowia lipolytica]RDW22592.1 hypothetical protein B0I71DRAFT_137317 [Yarrowia lipolytica]